MQSKGKELQLTYQFPVFYLEISLTSQPKRLHPIRQKKSVPRRLYGSIDGTMVPTQGEWRELKTICWYAVSPTSVRQWPSRYKQRIGELEGLKATDIRYHCDIQGAESFSKLLWGSGCHDLADRAQELIFVCDGAKWIWRLIKENFPEAIQILDWYHAVEYLTPIAQAIFKDEDKQTEWLATMKEHLWFSRTQTVIDICATLTKDTNTLESASKAMTPKLLQSEGEELDKEYEYVLTHSKERGKNENT